MLELAISSKAAELANFGARFQFRLRKMQELGLAPGAEIQLRLWTIRNGATCLFSGVSSEAAPSSWPRSHI